MKSAFDSNVSRIQPRTRHVAGAETKKGGSSSTTVIQPDKQKQDVQDTPFQQEKVAHNDHSQQQNRAIPETSTPEVVTVPLVNVPLEQEVSKKTDEESIEKKPDSDIFVKQQSISDSLIVQEQVPAVEPVVPKNASPEETTVAEEKRANDFAVPSLPPVESVTPAPNKIDTTPVTASETQINTDTASKVLTERLEYITSSSPENSIPSPVVSQLRTDHRVTHSAAPSPAAPHPDTILKNQIKAAVQAVYAKQKEPTTQPTPSQPASDQQMPQDLVKRIAALSKQEEYDILRLQLKSVLQDIDIKSGQNVPARNPQPSSQNASDSQSSNQPKSTDAFTRLRNRLQSAIQTDVAATDVTPWSTAETTKKVIDTFRLKLNALTQERNALENNVNSLRNEVKNLQVQLTEKAKDTEAAQQLAQERIALAQDIINEMEIVTSERDQALTIVGQMKTRDQMQTKLLTDVEIALNFKNEQIEKLRNREIDLQQQISIKNQEFEHLSIELSRMAAERDELNDRVSKLEKELHSSLESRKALAEIRHLIEDAKM